jgi:hypothetical protein
MMSRTRTSILAGAALSLVATCAHESSAAKPSKTEWSSRIGNYKMDQAFNDLGPPAQEREIPGGGRVCTWPRQGTATIATHNPPPTSYGTTTTEVQQNDVLILTFDENKVLVNCVSPGESPPSK